MPRLESPIGHVNAVGFDTVAGGWDCAINDGCRPRPSGLRWIENVPGARQVREWGDHLASVRRDCRPERSGGS
jgi:hypothetical protein